MILKNCRPFSINSAYYKRTMTLTRECRAWRESIQMACCTKENLLYLHEFRDSFERMRLLGPTGIYIAIEHRMPYGTFWTTKGEISRRSMDITNIEKLLVDVLFDPKFAERGDLDNLRIDDKYITEMVSKKSACDSYEIEVELDLRDLRYLREPEDEEK